MFRKAALLVVTVLMVSGASFEVRAETELDKCRALRDAKLKEIWAEYGESVKESIPEYQLILDAGDQRARKAGDLEGLLAIRDETARLKREETVPSGRDESLHSSVRSARQSYARILSSHSEKRRSSANALGGMYADMLDSLTKRLTMDGDIDGALEVRAEATKVRALVKSGSEFGKSAMSGGSDDGANDGPVLVDCVSCTGTGQGNISCPVCKGGRRCVKCGGKGRGVSAFTGSMALCMHCRGTGNCKACAGSGTAPAGACMVCAGNGRVEKRTQVAATVPESTRSANIVGSSNGGHSSIGTEAA